MKLKEEIEYGYGCKVVFANRIYSNPESKYSLQLCKQHRELCESEE